MLDVVMQQVDQELIIDSCPLFPLLPRVARLILVSLDIFTRLERSLRDIRFRVVFRLRLDFMMLRLDLRLRLDFLLRLVFLLLLLDNLSRLRFASFFGQFDNIVSQLVGNSPASKVVVGAAHLDHGDRDDIHDGWRGQLASQVSSACGDSCRPIARRSLWQSESDPA